MDFHVRGLTRVGGGRRGVPRNFSTLKRLRFYLCVASLWKSCQRFNNFPLGLCRDRLEGNECKIGSFCENRARGELVRRPCWETALRRREKKKRRRREKKWPIESIQCVLTRRRKHGATGSLLLLLPPSSPGYWFSSLTLMPGCSWLMRLITRVDLREWRIIFREIVWQVARFLIHIDSLD